MSKLIIAAVALPPPVHGQSIVSKFVIENLEKKKNTRLHVIDLSPKSNSKNIKYHFNRLSGVIKVLIFILKNWKVRNKTIYTVYEAGYGVLYNYAILGVANLLNYRIFIHHHTSLHTLKFDLKFKLLNLIVEKNVQHIVLSEKMKDDLKSKYSINNYSHIVNNAGFVFESSNSLKLNVDHNSPIKIGYISNLTVEKGFKTVLSLIEQFLLENYNFEFYIAGPLMSAELEAKLNKILKTSSAKIKYLGPVDLKKKRIFFNKIDIAVFPTEYKYEAQPLVILEAMANSVPVFSVRKGYIPELLDEKYLLDSDEKKFIYQFSKIFESVKNDRNKLDFMRKEVLIKFEKLNCKSRKYFESLINEINISK